MPRYWLAPITSREPFTLGDERIVCVPESSWDVFRQRLARNRPPLLFPFKAHLLVADDSRLACGADEIPFALSSPGELVFDGERLALSECGRAMLDKLPAAAALAAWLDADETEGEGAATSSGAGSALEWLVAMRLWLERGWGVILLKEESNV